MMVTVDYKNGKMLFESGNEDKNIRVIAVPGEDCVHVTAEDEWCGDTESGFGAVVTGSISKAEVVELVAFLAEWLGAEAE